MEHLIKKQQLELAIGRNQDAFRIQQLASAYYWRTLLPVLEKAFDEMSSADEVIELGRLEINLGTISEENLEQNKLTPELESTIKKLLKELIAAPPSKDQAIRKSKAGSICGQWLYYMEHGYVPWNTITINDEWYEKVLEAFAGDFENVTALRSILLSSSRISSRIVLQHNENFLLHLVEILTAKNQDNLPIIIDELYELIIFIYKNNNSLHKHDERLVKQKLWEGMLHIAAGREDSFAPDLLAKKIITQHISTSLLLQPIPTELFSKLKLISPVLNELRNDLTQFKKSASAGKNVTGTNEIKTSGKVDKPGTEQEKPSKRPIRKSENEVFTSDISNAPDDKDDIQKMNELFSEPVAESIEFNNKTIDEEGIFVYHAGLVLIHPFVTTLFRRLQVVDGKLFVDNYSRQKALQILHYLGAGRTGGAEYELVVPKLLCNYYIHEPVSKEISLTQDELSEADDMLKAVILQWDKIKNSSVDAFRQGFLQRKGKLFSMNNMLWLQVEGHAIDILLDYLPWNLSLIKLPWMKEILHVEWR